MDLSDLVTLDGDIDTLLQESEPLNQYERVILINNAGSLGHLGPAINLVSLQELRQCIDFNVTSSLWLTTRFAKAFPSTSAKCFFINISSLCALEPFSTMATYCTGKAARDMYHRVIARELEDLKHIKFLNYAPGALDTDMTNELRTTEELDVGLKKYFRSAHEQEGLIPPEKTAAKLVRLIKEDEFQSGEHIDYWDIYEEKPEGAKRDDL
jgi:sepiapterin reductase